MCLGTFLSIEANREVMAFSYPSKHLHHPARLAASKAPAGNRSWTASAPHQAWEWLGGISSWVGTNSHQGMI